MKRAQHEAWRCARWCAVSMLGWALSAQAAAAASNDDRLDKSLSMFVHVTNQRATSLGVHTATVRNIWLRPLLIRPRALEDWPKQGNGIGVALAPFRLAVGSQQDIRYTVSTNDSPGDSPFTMSRAFALDISMEYAPERKGTVPLVLSANLDPAQVVQVTVPAVGAAGSHVCASPELEHTPQALWPVHCRNTLPDAQAGSFPLDMYVAPADPAQIPNMRTLHLDQVYRTRYVDGSTEPLNCRSPCTIDFARGRQVFGYTPTKPGVGHELEPLVPGLPRISRRMLGDEPDVVLEVERRPDLMDPVTRVDTVHAACIGDDCGADAIVIDAVERIDDEGHGFEAPPREQIRRYAPDGELSAGMTLAPAGRRNRAELAWRITDASQGAYVESHYEIVYHGRDGRRRRYVSPNFGGILEPPVGSRPAAPNPGAVPPWAHQQLRGPFMRLDLPDASMTRQSVLWETPPLDSQMRLLSALMTGEAGRMGSGTLLGMPKLRADYTIDHFQVLSALHLLIPLFHNGLSAAEYLGLYDDAIEATLSRAWFEQEEDIDVPDPTSVRLLQSALLGYSFNSQRNAVIQVSAPQMPATPDVHVPDVMVYTVHPAERLPVRWPAIDAAPLLQVPLPLESQILDVPVSMLGFPHGASYPAEGPGSTQIIFQPLIHSPFPALRSRMSTDRHVPFNAHELVLGNSQLFHYSMLNPLTGEVTVTGSEGWIFRGLSGSGVLSHLEWDGTRLRRAVLRGVESAGAVARDTGELRLLYIGLDVEPYEQAGRDYHMWLLSQLS